MPWAGPWARRRLRHRCLCPSLLSQCISPFLFFPHFGLPLISGHPFSFPRICVQDFLFAWHPWDVWHPARVGILGWSPSWSGCSPPPTFPSLRLIPFLMCFPPPRQRCFPPPFIGPGGCRREWVARRVRFGFGGGGGFGRGTGTLHPGWIFSALRGISTPFHPRASLLLAWEGLTPPFHCPWHIHIPTIVLIRHVLTISFAVLRISFYTTFISSTLGVSTTPFSLHDSSAEPQ